MGRLLKGGEGVCSLCQNIAEVHTTWGWTGRTQIVVKDGRSRTSQVYTGFIKNINFEDTLNV